MNVSPSTLLPQLASNASPLRLAWSPPPSATASRPADEPARLGSARRPLLILGVLIGLMSLAIGSHVAASRLASGATASLPISEGPRAANEDLALPPAQVKTSTVLPPAPEVPPPGGIDADKDRRVSDAIRRARLSTVTLEYEAGSTRRVASGVVINDQGEVLAIRIDPPADRARASIIAYDSSGRRHSTRWLAADAETGLTLLRVNSGHLKPIRLAAGDPSLGAEVFLVGNPYGLGHSVNRGHIAGLGRRLTLGSQILGGLIQVQATLHPGDSGALLADLDGGWLGLIRGSLAAPGLTTTRDNDLGFAISARDALWIADRLRASGKVDRAYLGLRFALDSDPERMVNRPVPTPPGDPGDDPVGAQVVEVVSGSPADRSGLRPGDRLTRIDDRPVIIVNDLTDRLDRTAAGAEVTLEYLRGTSRSQAVVRSTSRPAVLPQPELTAVSPAPSSPQTARPPSPPTRADETAQGVIQALRDRLERIEKRVEQLERASQGRKSVSNP